jgi:ABC-2 type transport system permease protein
MDKKIFIIAKREYLERVRTRWFVVMTLLVPVLMAGLILIPAYIAAHSGASNEIRHITIIDATGHGLGDRVAAALMADSGSARVDSIRPRVETVSAADVAAREAAATAEVKMANHIAGYLVLTDSTTAGQSARYAGRNASSISDMDKLQSIIRQSVMISRLEREGVKPEIVNELSRSKLHLASERLNEKGRAGSGETGIIAGIAVGVLLMMSIVIHGQNILRGVLEEKSSRVAEVVISSVKPSSLLAGKILGVGGVGLTQQAAWYAISGYLVSFVMPILLKGSTVATGGGGLAGSMGGLSWPLIGIALAYFVVGFVFYATLYAAAGSMVNSEQEAQQAAVPVMILIMTTWVMVNPVIAAPNGNLAVVLSWLPWSSPIIMPMRVGLTGVSSITIAGSLLVAIGGSVLAMLLSARIYRVGMLMYGKKPSLGEVMKWIRYA